jgi:hypothetical protein
VIAKAPGEASRGVPSSLLHTEREMISWCGLTLGKLVLFGRIDEAVSEIRTDTRHI